jgi:hypothetical protein
MKADITLVLTPLELGYIIGILLNQKPDECVRSLAPKLKELILEFYNAENNPEAIIALDKLEAVSHKY